MPSNTPYVDVPFKISEHRSLNSSIGIIYSNNLRGIDEKVILDNLKSQKVERVEKIYKYIPNQVLNKTPQNETGLIKISFKLTHLPDFLYIGYERVEVRTFIPRPMRCNNCFRFGHTAKFCKNTPTCANCGLDAHVNYENSEICQNKPNCINCSLKKLPTPDHHARNKDCPVFLSNKEVQAIKTLQKVDNRTAWSI
nr:uncharacterized protein LOC122321349 [Drosophila bipectinata]